jgi:hypothetical protein
MALQRVLGYVSRTLKFGIWFRGMNHKAEGIVPTGYYNVDHGIKAHVGATGPLDNQAFLGPVWQTLSKSIIWPDYALKNNLIMPRIRESLVDYGD